MATIIPFSIYSVVRGGMFDSDFYFVDIQMLDRVDRGHSSVTRVVVCELANLSGPPGVTKV